MANPPTSADLLEEFRMLSEQIGEKRSLALRDAPDSAPALALQEEMTKLAKKRDTLQEKLYSRMAF